MRGIRSFVKREGRKTARQQRALETLWEQYVIDLNQEIIDFTKIFGCNAPVVLEIGFGNGNALFEIAKARPECHFVGIEVYKPGIGTLLAKLEETKLNNVRIINEDAVKVLNQHIKDESLDAISIFFPDPWPKKRHHKRRLIQPAFCGLLAKKLKAKGRLHLATDWEDYAVQMMDVVSNLALFYNQFGEGRFATDTQDRPLTKFEKRGQQLGHKIWDLIFIKTCDIDRSFT